MVVSVMGLALTARSAGAVPPHVVVDDDRFSSRATLSGPMVIINPFGGVTRDWHLRSWVDKKTKAVTDQLYVDISYIGSAWSFYDFAADENANDLEVTRIDSSVDGCRGGCDYTETLGVALDHAALVAHAGKDYQIKLSAKDGSSLILTLTAQQIDLQLAAEAREIAILNGETPPPDPNAPPDLNSSKPLPPNGPVVTLATTAPKAAVLDAARRVLTSQGYSVVDGGPGGDELTTAPLHKKLTLREADCGRKWGIPYLLDGRTKTNVSVSVTVSGSEVKVQSGIIGLMKTGFGAADLPLTCVSKGVIEADVSNAIKAALPAG